VELTATSGARLAAPRHRVAADEVLDAACAVFAAEGFANANMDAIAARAGMTKPTLYARFGPKERLFAAVVRREHEMLNDWVTAGYLLGEDEPFHQRLHRWIGVYFDFVRERPDGFKLTFEGERHAAAAQAIEEATDDRISRIMLLIAAMSGVRRVQARGWWRRPSSACCAGARGRPSRTRTSPSTTSRRWPSPWCQRPCGA
jgi:AcrR family transcriptional regulator